MKISFDDGDYLEFQRSKKPQHIHVMVTAKSPDNHLELLINSAEVSLSKLIEAVKSVSGPIVIQQGKQNENIEDNNSGNSEDNY